MPRRDARNQMSRDRSDDWARDIQWNRDRGPYRDYGWEAGKSVLPEFRDPSIHEQDYDRARNVRQQSGRQNRSSRNDWARDIQWNRGGGPYRDYGWEADESALPEFRDPSIHAQQYERQRGSQAGPYTGYGPKNYQRPDNSIMDEACERLKMHGQIDAHDIKINVKKGEVTLEGTVEDRHMKRMTEDIIDRVRGVVDVHNQLKLRNKGQSGRPGGGRNRIDRVGRTGVYPASGPFPDVNAETQDMASWGQGERGAAGYYDHGKSEIHVQNRNKK